MKNISVSLSVILLFIFLFTSNVSFSQSDKKIKRLFVDFDISALFVDATFMAHASVGTGFRFNEKVGAGLELRSSTRFRSSSSFGLSGLGTSFRYTDKWFVGKITLGKVLRAYRATNEGGRGYEWGEEWQYRKGGFYSSISIAYRLRPGFLFGLSYTGVRNSKFDFFFRRIDTGELTFDSVRTTNFGTFGIMAGMALPSRGHKDLRK